MLDRLISPVFRYIAGTLVEAFVRRAGQIYRSKPVTGDP
jgi:ribosome-associated toxin RatA of RatAB toxin-antitoxin module